MYENLTKFIGKLTEGKLCSIEKTGNGTMENPVSFSSWYEYSEDVHDFIKNVYDFFPKGVNYFAVLNKYNMEASNKDFIERDVSDFNSELILNMILTIIRQERFGEGLINEFISNGCFDKWLKRLKEIDESEKRLFILRWNPNISSFTINDYKELLQKYYTLGTYIPGLNWSIKDWKKVNKNDIFILQQVGTENDGFVMIGKLRSAPYEAESWKNDGTKSYYADLDIFSVYDRTKNTKLSADEYEKLFDFTKWHSGASGEILEGENVNRLLNKISQDLQDEDLWETDTFSYFRKEFLNDGKKAPSTLKEFLH